MDTPRICVAISASIFPQKQISFFFEENWRKSSLGRVEEEKFCIGRIVTAEARSCIVLKGGGLKRWKTSKVDRSLLALYRRGSSPPRNSIPRLLFFFFFWLLCSAFRFWAAKPLTPLKEKREDEGDESKDLRAVCVLRLKINKLRAVRPVVYHNAGSRFFIIRTLKAGRGFRSWGRTRFVTLSREFVLHIYLCKNRYIWRAYALRCLKALIFGLVLW